MLKKLMSENYRVLDKRHGFRVNILKGELHNRDRVAKPLIGERNTHFDEMKLYLEYILSTLRPWVFECAVCMYIARE